MAALLLSAFAPQATQAQSVETGTGYFVCHQAAPCNVGQLLATPPCIDAPPTVCSGPNGMTIWSSYKATLTQLVQSVMVTVEISTTNSSLPSVTFAVFAFSGSKLSYVLSEVDLQVPFAGITSVQKSFSVLASSFVLVPWCFISPVTGMCSTTTPLIPPNTVYTVNWQIEDPSSTGSSQTSLSVPLLALFAVPLAGVAYVGYWAGKRRKAHYTIADYKP